MLLLNQCDLSRITATAAETVTFESFFEAYLHCFKLVHRLITCGSYSNPLHLSNLGKSVQQYLKRA